VRGTLRGRLVLVLGAVVATACVALVAIGILGSALLLRREQDAALRSESNEQCEEIRSEAAKKGLDVPTAAREHFEEGHESEFRVELTDRQQAVRAAYGDLEGWTTGTGHFRTAVADCSPEFAIRVIASDVLFDRSVRRAGATLLTALPIAALLGIVLGGIAIARSLRPLDDLERAAARLTASSPLALGVGARPAELARLERSMDALLERLGAALARERRFAQEASHELRTPLTALRARIDSLAAARSQSERDDDLRAIVRELHSLEALVEALLLLARSEDAPLPRVPVNLCDLARIAARRQGLIDPAKGSPIEVEAPDEILVRGSEELLDRAIGNVVENARKFAGPTARIRVRVEAISGRGVVSVADDGPGIAPASRPMIFDRFFRDPAQRQASDGAGLGLAVVRAIALRHGGSVTAGTSDLGGADLRIELPLL